MAGELLECAIRSYDPDGKFEGEAEIEIADGSFGQDPLEIEAELPAAAVD